MTTVEPIIKQRVNLHVPYADKDDAKQHGARYDVELKQWYTTESNKSFKYLVDKYSQPIKKGLKIYLSVPFDDKDDAKGHGAWYDAENKAWFTWANNPNKDYLIQNFGEV
jgi:hypothetical protein